MTEKEAFVEFVGQDRRHKLLRLAKKFPDEAREIWKAYGQAFTGDRRAWARADKRLDALWKKLVRGG
jgi:hypothetical protein